MAKHKQEIVPEASVTLRGRLEAYPAPSDVRVSAGNRQSRLGNWPIYAAATGSALAMATAASASIITGTYLGATVQPQGAHGANSTKNNGQTSVHASSIKGLYFGLGTDHIGIKAQSGIAETLGGNSAQPFARLSVLAVNPAKIFFTSSSLAKKFDGGAKIVGGPVVAGGRIVAGYYTGVPFGQFVAGQTAYAGLAINVGGGNVDYGWLKLKFTDNIDTGLPETLTIFGYGIETTANTPIHAGETADGTTTPEPGTLPLSILAAGAAGVIALRRRRQAQ